MKRKCASLLLILGVLSPGMAAALGLGEISLKSYLNEPLEAEVQLLETGDLDPSQIRVRLATREDFSRAGVDRAYFLTSLRFEVVGGEQGPLLLITSRDPVREPYLDFIVEARWPTGRLLREYTVLLDPPVFVGDESGISARASTSRPTPPTSQPTAPPAPAPAPPAPDRDYGRGALDSPSSGEQYMVKRGDILWRIAESAAPSGASVQQTMLDIQRLNPEAFIGGNINQLKAGYVLRLPTASEITPQSFEEAVREVERQTRRWQDAAAGLEVRMDASEGLDMSGSPGSDRGEGHLQIAGVESGDETMSAGEISARMEDLDRSRRENAELSTRVSAMEEQLQMQERLLSLKDEQIAALQDALSDAGAEVEMPVDAQEGTIETIEEPAPEEAVEEVAEEVAEPEPAPAPAPRRPAPEPTILDMVMDNIIYVGAGVLVLILLLLFLLRSKLSVPSIGRKKDQEMPVTVVAGDEDDFADVSLSEDSLIVDEVDEDSEAEPAEPVSSFSAPDEEAYAAQFESGDALAEADIYIAYGRFPQAVDLLKAAIAHEPVNTDYRIKLMEACIEMVESGEFQQQYADLQVIGDENVLNRARSLLEAVDGGEVWLSDLPEPSISPDQVSQARAAAPESEEGATEMVDLSLDEDAEEGLDAEGGLDLDLDEAGEEGGLDLDLDEAEEAEEGGLDLDVEEADEGGLELDIEEPAEELDTLEFEQAEEETAADDEGLEFDLETEEPESAADALDELTLDTTPALEAEPAEEEISLDDIEDLAVEEEGAGEIELPDLELDDLAAEPAAEEAAEEALDLGGDDLLSDLDDLDVGLSDEEPAESELADVSMSLDEDSDLMDLSSDLDTEPAAEPAGAEAESALDVDSELDGVEFDLSADDSDGDLADLELDMSGDEGEEGLVFAADGDEMATKLDLARAYIDMGDHDGARTILEEVVGSGNESQQQEARSLLEGID